MAYCPQCLTEYVEGSEECIDCHVPLEGGAPPKPVAESEQSGELEVELVRVRTFSGLSARFNAELAKNILEAVGIPGTLPGEFSVDLYPGAGVVQLLVRAEDAAKAGEILKDYLDDPRRGAAAQDD
jgi:hypothetical protein